MKRSLFLLPLLVACSSTTTVAPQPAPAAPPATPPAAEVPPVVLSPAPSAPVGDPQKAEALVEQGRAMQRERGEGGAQEAIKLYQEALAAQPGHASALWELGWSYQVAGDFEAAVTAWQTLKKQSPDYPELGKHWPVLLMRRDQARALAALPDPGVLPPREEIPREGPSLTLNGVGDVQLGRGWPPARAELPPDDARVLFGPLKGVLQNADVTFGNLETALADTGESTKCGPKSTKCFAFRAPTSFAAALQEAGFDVMSIANNHAGDFGLEGRLSTKKALDGVGIRYSGTVGDIASLEANGLRIGLIAFSTGGDVYRVQEIDVARRVVAETKRLHDVVIVSFHAGAEGSEAGRVPKGPESFYGESRGDVYAFAHAVVDAGADLVMGHGPHRFRGMELYKGRLIAYSLGNFCTYKTFSLVGPLAVTGVLKVTLAANGVATAITLQSAVIEQPGIPTPDPKGQAVEIVRGLSQQDFGSALLGPDGTWQRPTAIGQQ